MLVRSTLSTLMLFIGDTVALTLSLWLTLLVRYGELPERERLTEHFIAFTPLFLVWLLVFYMAGLYGKNVLLFKSSVLRTIVQTQFFNIVLAALYFFVMPGITLAPKTNLVLYLIISLALMLSWRFVLFPLTTRPVSRERAALIGSGEEVEELVREVNSNERYHVSLALVIDPESFEREIDTHIRRIGEEGITTIIVDSQHPRVAQALPAIYGLTFEHTQYHLLEISQVYEEVFDRVPLSLLQTKWFVENVSAKTDIFYAFSKRFIDIFGALVLGLITVVLAPIIALCMRIEGKGPLFITQRRFGKNGAIIHIYKFRSMLFSDDASKQWVTEGENKITNVGHVLRFTSIDEFPQCINILKGEMSLIGPRNDIEGLGQRLQETIPYYSMRYMVTPGITGWAQINQQYHQGNISPQSVDETKTRLAYDFYYIKHRSLALDIEIALKTVKRMLFRGA